MEKVVKTTKVVEKMSEVVTSPIVKKLPITNQKRIVVAVSFIVVIFLGVGTGWVLARESGVSKGAPGSHKMASEVATKEGGNELFAESEPATGVLKEGGIDGEGTHRLERGMGKEMDVALLSTFLDLSSFIDKKVEVWGKSVSSPSVGWLMDVEKVKEVQ